MLYAHIKRVSAAKPLGEPTSCRVAAWLQRLERKSTSRLVVCRAGPQDAKDKEERRLPAARASDARLQSYLARLDALEESGIERHEGLGRFVSKEERLADDARIEALVDQLHLHDEEERQRRAAGEKKRA